MINLQPISTAARAALGWCRARPWRVAGAAAVVLLLGYWWWGGEDEDAPQPLIVAVSRGDIENAVTATGSLQPSDWVDVGAQVSGQLRSLAVQVGDQVVEGQLLAEIDASVQINRVEASRAGLEAERAQLSAREAAVALARSNLERQQELSEQNLASRNDLDRAVNDLAAAESALAELESRIVRSNASLASDEAQLGYSRIYAPMAGTVVSVSMTVGQTLNATQQVPTILRIADLTTMTVQADVSEADVGQLKVGTPVYFTTLGGGERRWNGTVRQILPSPTVQNNVVFYPVLFDVDNADGALLPQMTAQVFFVVSARQDVLTVPVGALRYADGRADVASVVVVDESGDWETREVTLGLSNRVSAEVQSGLVEGERVIAGYARPPRSRGATVRIR
jgi:macrolide-specific efflux system membrane fusion protein